MLVYRIGSTVFANDLTGKGAELYGGRWNHVGTSCLYTGISRAIALLEYTTHVKINLIPSALSFVTLEVPEHSIQRYTTDMLPVNWKEFPHPKETRNFGTDFLRANKFLLYAIPSVVIEEEMNYIINPSHPDMKKVKIVEVKDYAYDLRLKS